MSEQCGCEVSAGRKSHHADSGGIDLPLPGVFPDQPHALFGIFERDAVVSVGHAVFQHHAGDALSGQPRGERVALLPHRERTVSAAGCDQYGCPGVPGRICPVDLQYRITNICREPFRSYLRFGARQPVVLRGRGRPQRDF